MKNVLITGGSDGIGLAVARLIAAEGDARVTLTARTEAKLREAVESLPGGGHDYIVADVSQPRGVEIVTRQLASKRYDVLINNAGTGLYGRFTDLALDDQLRMMALNMESVVVLSHAFLGRANTGAALVNTASFVGYAPLPGAAVYSATKAFVAALSETLWWEYRKKGVYVLGFIPGVVATAFHTAAGGSVDEFPRILTQSPERVAGEMVAALRRRKLPRVISGRGTRLFLLTHRFVSRRIAIDMMGTSSPIPEAADSRSRD
jgi:uncharacterized protein